MSWTRKWVEKCHCYLHITAITWSHCCLPPHNDGVTSLLPVTSQRWRDLTVACQITAMACCHCFLSHHSNNVMPLLPSHHSDSVISLMPATSKRWRNFIIVCHLWCHYCLSHLSNDMVVIVCHIKAMTPCYCLLPFHIDDVVVWSSLDQICK